MPDIENLLQSVQGFDAFGPGFDDETALRFGMTRDATGHMGSVVPTTPEQQRDFGLPENSFMILKGRRHPTFDKAVAGEKRRGFMIREFGGRFFSLPNQTNNLLAQ